MKSIHSLPLGLLVTLVAAIPIAEPQLGSLLGYEYNDLKKGDCKDVTFIWTRGTTEISNMGEYVGGRLVPYLKKQFPSLAIQGVDYGAGIAGNLLPGGGDPSGIAEAVKMYNLAASKCPQTVITGGGYSQGAAITHRAVEKLSEDVKSRIAAITLYGDTQYYQDGGKIKGFPPEKVHTYCNGYAEWKSYSSDGVCNGLLLVNYGHMSYGDAFQPGAAFLREKVDSSTSATKSSSGSKSSKSPKKSSSSSSDGSSDTQEEEAPKPKSKKSKSKSSDSGSSSSGSSDSSETPAPAPKKTKSSKSSGSDSSSTGSSDAAPAPKKTKSSKSSGSDSSSTGETSETPAPAAKKSKASKSSESASSRAAIEGGEVTEATRAVEGEEEILIAGSVPEVL